jgi:hypothetical protein
MHDTLENNVMKLSTETGLRPCFDATQILNFFTLSITLIFGRMHGALNIGKKITNCTVW